MSSAGKRQAGREMQASGTPPGRLPSPTEPEKGKRKGERIGGSGRRKGGRKREGGEGGRKGR